jgi:hypothetical protein
MDQPGSTTGTHELAVFYLCAILALAIWAALFGGQVDRQKYTLQAILTLMGLLAVGLAIGNWLLGR